MKKAAQIFLILGSIMLIGGFCLGIYGSAAISGYSQLDATGKTGETFAACSALFFVAGFILIIVNYALRQDGKDLLKVKPE